MRGVVFEPFGGWGVGLGGRLGGEVVREGFDAPGRFRGVAKEFTHCHLTGSCVGGWRSVPDGCEGGGGLVHPRVLEVEEERPVP